MQENFKKYFYILERVEGGYANHKSDLGQETYKGICRKNHPTLSVWKSLDNLSTVKEKKAYTPSEEELNEIRNVYWSQYAKKINWDLIQNEKVAFLYFDFAVNSGVATATKKVQQMLGIKADGICGQQTIGTINSQPRVYQRLMEARKQFYANLIKANPSQKVFETGWNNRLKIIDKELNK